MTTSIEVLGGESEDKCRSSLPRDMKERVFQIIKDNPGYTEAELFEKIPSGISCTSFKNLISLLIKTNKLAEDGEGRLCWIYNPELTHTYLSRPELFI